MRIVRHETTLADFPSHISASGPPTTSQPKPKPDTLDIMARPLLLLVAIALLACGPGPRAHIPKAPGRVDAPYELASNEDLLAVRETFDAMSPQDSQREKKRVLLINEYRRRLRSALLAGHRSKAFARFENLISLWGPSELSSVHSRPSFVALVPEAKSIRKTFAKSGDATKTVAALYALALMQPAQAGHYHAEIDEIYSYVDELAMLQHGLGATRARPIEILETTTASIPSEHAIDHLVTLYQERQAAIQSSFRRKGADIRLIRIHGAGVLSSTHSIVGALAKAGRIDEALLAISKLSGIGDDANLRQRLRGALASTTPTSWLLLASSFRGEKGDKRATLAICLEAIARYPNDAMSHFCAGDAAEALGRSSSAIRHYKTGLAIDPLQRDASEALGTLYERRVSALAFGDRPNAAGDQLAVFEAFHRDTAMHFEAPIEPDLASAYAAMAHGLVSLGALEEARHYLARSIKLRPNLFAYEYLGTIALRQENFSRARAHFARALSLQQDAVLDTFHHARLRRLAAEAAEGENEFKAAKEHRNVAMTTWLRLLRDYELSPSAQAEARIEMGKLMFALGMRENAMREFLTALGHEVSSSDHADIVAFLLAHDSRELAEDIYLDALGREHVGQYFKIYMSLWVLAEGKRLGLEPSLHATRYLRMLQGPLWSVHLAQYALGTRKRAELEAMASTRGRHAELLYYDAVLGPHSGDSHITQQLLQEVVAGSMVLFFEYSMAKKRLREMP